jgi:TonB family protein
MFLVSLQDEIEHSHRRQAFWMSVLAHLVALVVFINGAKLLPADKILGPAKTEVLSTHEYTFLVLPPDLQKNVPPPHTSVLSDKNRIASSPQPVLDRKVLQHILAGNVDSTEKVKAPHVKALLVKGEAHHLPRALAQAAIAPAPRLIHAGAPQMKDIPAANPGFLTAEAPTTSTPPASAATDVTVADGLDRSPSSPASQSNVDVLSDTMGVNFGPYLTRVLHAVRLNWFNRIPESARAPLMKRGKVSVQFDILKTGQIAAVQVVGTSGDPSLDGAAVSGISGSGPFPPLPPQFQGQYLALRFHFFYNPDNADLR